MLRPGGCVPPAAASLPAVTGPAGWHWWDLTDWSTAGTKKKKQHRGVKVDPS